MDGRLESFVSVVEEFCSWVESELSSEPNELKTAIRLLANLYSKVLELPVGNPNSDFDPDKYRITDEEWHQCFKRFGSLPFNYYWVILNPADIKNESLGMGDLADDLADIYRDIKFGLVLYQDGHEAEAVWEWRNGFAIHWGGHAASALYALHSYASANSIDI